MKLEDTNRCEAEPGVLCALPAGHVGAHRDTAGLAVLATKEELGEQVARALLLLEELFLELAELGVDPLATRTLKEAGEELILQGVRVALRAGLNSLPALERGERVWIHEGRRIGLAELAERLQDCRKRCSERARLAARALPG